jgi:hypothetical protein
MFFSPSSFLSPSLCFLPFAFFPLLSNLHSASDTWLHRKSEKLAFESHIEFHSIYPSPRSILFETLNSKWQKRDFNNLKETYKQMVPISVTLKTSSLKRNPVFEAASTENFTMTVK